METAVIEYAALHRRFKIWSDLTPDELEAIEGQAGIIDYREDDRSIVMYHDPRYDPAEIKASIMAMAMSKKNATSIDRLRKIHVLAPIEEILKYADEVELQISKTAHELRQDLTNMELSYILVHYVKVGNYTLTYVKEITQ